MRKKILLLIILILGLFPVLEEGELKLESFQKAYAQIDGNELPEVIIEHDPCDEDPFACGCDFGDLFCDDEGDDDGEEEEEDPCEFDPSCDCPDYAMGNPEECDPDYYEEEEEELEEESIEDELTDPCLKSVLATVMNGNNSISNLLKTLFSSSSGRTITFGQYTDAANTNIDGVHGGTPYHHTINLNLAALGDASKEHIMATIYHEIYHAYLRTEGVPGSQHHDLIAYNWKDDIAAALMDDFLSLTLDDAHALAWGGLGESALWQNMMDNDTQNNTSITSDIVNTNKEYKNLNNEYNGNHGTQCSN